MSLNKHKVNIATLNCRGLKKIRKPKKRQHFIRCLRSAGYDILVLQETHATDPLTIEQFNLQFQTKSSIWNAQTGIISLNSSYIFQLVDSGIDGGRYILANIQLNNSNGDQSIATMLYSQHRRASTILGSLCSLIFDYA
jgi:exonuclease III